MSSAAPVVSKKRDYFGVPYGVSSVPQPAVVPPSVPAVVLPSVPAVVLTSIPAAKKQKTAKKESAHALLWICAAGKGQGRAWKQKALRIIGVYASKEAAEKKKEQLMQQYECCGHGDIVVGGTWEDEIDLVVRAVEEVAM